MEAQLCLLTISKDKSPIPHKVENVIKNKMEKQETLNAQITSMKKMFMWVQLVFSLENKSTHLTVNRF